MGVLFVGHSGTFWGISPMGRAPCLSLLRRRGVRGVRCRVVDSPLRAWRTLSGVRWGSDFCCMVLHSVAFPLRVAPPLCISPPAGASPSPPYRVRGRL